MSMGSPKGEGKCNSLQFFSSPSLPTHGQSLNYLVPEGWQTVVKPFPLTSRFTQFYGGLSHAISSSKSIPKNWMVFVNGKIPKNNG